MIHELDNDRIGWMYSSSGSVKIFKEFFNTAYIYSKEITYVCYYMWPSVIVYTSILSTP